jgi:serine phosphatase RsbU (regulator of sigma subunit)/PAS domain-containing protein
MTSTRPSPGAEPALAGWRGWSARSALAPKPFTPVVWAGVAVVAALAALDVVTGPEILFGGLLVLPPLVVAMTGRWGDTAVVAALALLVVLANPLHRDDMPTRDFLIPVVVVGAGGIVAMAVALARTSTAVALERFRLLVGVADAAGDAPGPDTLVDAVLDLLVPALGDVAAVDASLGGRRRRLGARVAAFVDPAVEDAIMHRRPLPQDEARSTERSIAVGESRLVTEFDDGLFAAAASSPEDAALLAGLGMRSAVIVPLHARGAVVGAITCGLGPSGRRHSEADLRFAEVTAGRVALALDNAGLTSELTAAEEQLGAVVQSMAEAVTVSDASGQIVYANDAAVALLKVGSVEELLAAAPGEMMGRFAVYDEEGRPLGLADLPAARAVAGDDDVGPMLVRNVVRATGEERWLLTKISVLRDGRGELTRVVNVIEDVTEVKRAERGQALLARASEALASSLDVPELLRRVAEVAVPGLADWAAVELLGRGGRIQQIALVHADAALEDLARELRRRHPIRIDDDGVLAGVLRSGRAALLPRILPKEIAEDDEDLDAMRRIGVGSVMIVPLQAGSETLGAITLATRDPLRTFRDPELELARELGRRTGTAVLNARMFARRTAIAQALQHGLLPPELPEVPGWAAAASYRPAGELNEVGGDFYDVFEGPDGWIVVIGDVAGQGAEAATRTSLARFTVRTAAELTGDVGRALAHLNDTLRSQPGLPLCTAVCARLAERADGTAVLTLASAGHPPPLLVRGAAVTPLGHAGTIAGAFEGEAWPAATVELEPGDVIVLYTDGVLDAVGESDRFGEQRLREALEQLGGSVDERLAGLNAQLDAFQRGPQRDDTTVLVLEFRGGAGRGRREERTGEAAQ